jgi:hypothetical protein
LDTTYLDNPRSVSVSGRYAYVAAMSSNRLTVVDVADPANPTVVGSAAVGSSFSVCVSGRLAYVTSLNSNRLTVVDVTDPANPAVVGVVMDATNLDGAAFVSVSGRYAYVAAYDSDTFTVLDLAGMEAPTAHIGDIAAGSIETTGNIHSANNIIADGGLNVGPGGIKSDGPVAISDLLRLAPRAMAPSAATKGDMYIGTDGRLYIYNGSTWDHVVVNDDLP